jgi:hypothetical protein
MRQHARRQWHAALGLLRLFADDDIAETAFLQFAINLECLGQSHARCREQSEQHLVVLIETVQVALEVLDVGFIERQTGLPVVALPRLHLVIRGKAHMPDHVRALAKLLRQSHAVDGQDCGGAEPRMAIGA